MDLAGLNCTGLESTGFESTGLASTSFDWIRMVRTVLDWTGLN
jgi:hypothetical protein